MIEPEHVLEYWLGDASLNPANATKRKKLWYRSNSEVDDEIREKFAALYTSAVNGELNHWQANTEGSLALVILLDQFSRHLFRGKPEAFQQDDQALSIAEACPDPTTLPLISRAFLLHPFEHSERLEVQERSLQAFKQLSTDANPPWQPMMAEFYRHAKEHYDIVARFGRFPHRNAILGRQSTKEELDFLKESGKTFGQKQKGRKQRGQK